MRISEFYKQLIWSLLAISWLIISWIMIFNESIISSSGAILWFISTIISSTFFISINIIYAAILQDIINIKYKIIKSSTSARFDVKYLTIWFLFVPCWRPIYYNHPIYEAQIIFGATETGVHSSTATFKDKNAALVAIKKHKEDFHKNRIIFFEHPKKQKRYTEYIK